MLHLVFQKNSNFMIKADSVEDLITLARRGFYICANVHAYTDREEYVRLTEAEVRRQWTDLTALNTPARATYEDEHRIWTARYLRTRFGPYRDQNVQNAIAAVIGPRANYHSDRHVSWYFELGLHWTDTDGTFHKPLTESAKRLLALVQQAA